MEKKLIVIGGGPAGLAAALEARRGGVDASDILIIERDSETGGILNQCIHAGFGLHTFGEELTGPEYAERFIAEAEAAGIESVTDSMVLSVAAGDTAAGGKDAVKYVTFVSPKLGFVRARAEAVILAMGCRERTRGALNIPGTRPAGVFSAGTAQLYVNMEGYLPGRKVVILGSGDIGLIMARRMTLEGAKVLRVCELMPYSGGLARNIAQCLDDFDIPLYLSQTVTRIHGAERVEGVTVSDVDENLKPIPGSEVFVECDTLLLSVGLIPENELSREAGIELDRVTGGPVVNQCRQTSVPGIFACGNVLHVHDLVDFVTLEAYDAGAAAARYILARGGRMHGGVNTGTVKPGPRVRYVVPQKIEYHEEEPGLAPLNDKTKLYFRASNNYQNVRLTLRADGVELISKKKRVVAPGEMESITLDAKSAEVLKTAGLIEIAITD